MFKAGSSIQCDIFLLHLTVTLSLAVLVRSFPKRQPAITWPSAQPWSCFHSKETSEMKQVPVSRRALTRWQRWDVKKKKKNPNTFIAPMSEVHQAWYPKAKESNGNLRYLCTHTQISQICVCLCLFWVWHEGAPLHRTRMHVHLRTHGEWRCGDPSLSTSRSSAEHPLPSVT